MSELVFLLEEASAQAMLEGFLPKILPDGVTCRFIVFEGKQDLEKQLVKRLQGYLVPHARFVVLRDKDAEDCKIVKRRLRAPCNEAGKTGALIRIACHELESWYLGDLAAVEAGLELSNLKRQASLRKLRDPDLVQDPSSILKKAAPIYQKVSGSRAIGPHLSPDSNTSRSFTIFVQGIRRVSQVP